MDTLEKITISFVRADGVTETLELRSHAAQHLSLTVMAGGKSEVRISDLMLNEHAILGISGTVTSHSRSSSIRRDLDVSLEPSGDDLVSRE